MQTFEECVKSINEDARLFAEYGTLYYTLDAEKRPLDDADYLEKCFSFLRKSIRSFGLYVEKREENENGKTLSCDTAEIEKLHSIIAKKINVLNIQPRIKLKFDGTTEDINNFAQSLETVFEFHRILNDYISDYLSENLHNYKVQREPIITFASKLLHGCFPECFIPYDIKLYGKSKRLFHLDECIVRDCVVPEEIKHALFDERERVYNCLGEELRLQANSSQTERYLYFCTKVYALCRYLKENITTEIEYNPITLAITIFNSVVTMKRSDELTPKKRIFAYLEDNDGKGKPSVLCAVSEDEKHFFKEEFDWNIGEYLGVISGASPKRYATLDIPAAKTLVAFERFCKDECGFTSLKDSIIFADNSDWSVEIKCFTDYFRCFLLCADWVTVLTLEECYKRHTMYGCGVTYLELKKTCDTGLDEPYATKHFYEEYMRVIEKDKYDKEELDKMEQYVKSHLDVIYSDDSANSDVRMGFMDIFPKICLSDFKRFTALMDYFIDDYKNRNEKKARDRLWELLFAISRSVYCDYTPFNSAEEFYLFGQYGIYRCLTPENLRIVKEIIREQQLIQ